MAGRAAHTGSTPMSMRKNALLGVARVIEGVDRVAHEFAPQAVGTVGFVEVRPNSNNVIPGEVNFTIDMRHPDDAVLDRMEEKVRRIAEEAATAIGLELEFRCISRTDAVAFHPDCIAAVRHAAEKHGYTTHDIISGAGHDAAYTAAVVPTTMVFVPSEGGLSHNEAEATASHECAAGTQVLLDAVLEYDRHLTEMREAA